MKHNNPCGVAQDASLAAAFNERTAPTASPPSAAPWW